MLYSYSGTDALPSKPPYSVGYEFEHKFTAKAATWAYADPNPFMSNSATYYVAVPATAQVEASVGPTIPA